MKISRASAANTSCAKNNKLLPCFASPLSCVSVSVTLVQSGLSYFVSQNIKFSTVQPPPPFNSVKHLCGSVVNNKQISILTFNTAINDPVHFKLTEGFMHSTVC